MLKNIVIKPISVDHLLKRLEKGDYKKNTSKKDVNKHDKMKRGQGDIVKIISEHYGVEGFQTGGSGGLATINVNKLSEKDARVMAGDVRINNFLCVIEVKNGYGDISLDDLFIFENERGGKSSKNQLDEWIAQTAKEAKMTGLIPIICWKKDNKPWLCGFPIDHWNAFNDYFTPGCTMLCYNGFVFIRLEEFLKIPKEKLFSNEQ